MVEQNLKEFNGVWIFIEQLNGQFAPVSWELLGKGRELAGALETELAGVLLGHNMKDKAAEIFQYGADKVYLIDDQVLEHYRTPAYTHGLVNLSQKYKPEIILIGATSLGRDLAGAVATQLRTGLTADCTVLEVDTETRLLKQTRPAWGGNIMATILCRKHRPQMASVRPRVMAMPEPVPGRTGQIIEELLGLKEEDVPQKFESFEPVKGTAAIYLDKADIIVAVGRGIGSRDNFEQAGTLAKMLGGSLGGTRGAVEAGWLEYEHQIGQTGQTVRPRLYVALGISGAIQHLVGMQSSDFIVAVNKDPDASIFKVADHGIIADLNDILPVWLEELQTRPGMPQEV